MARAKLQDLPVEVLLLLPDDSDDDNDDDNDDDDDDDDDDDSNSDEDENDDSDDDNDDEGDDEDDDRNSYADIVSSRQNLIGCLARVNRRFHSIFEPILYRTAVKAKNNAITTLAARDDRLETLKKAVDEIPRGNGVAQLFGLDPTNSEKAAAIRKRLKSLICSIGTSGSMFNYPNFRRLEQWSQWSPAGTTMSALQTAVAINDYTMARHLIVNHGVDIYATDGAGATTLHYSLMTGKIKMVRYLLSLGADPNVCLDLNSDLLPIQNAAGWVVFYHDQYSNGGVTKFLDQALQALLDSGVTCWVQRSEGDSDDDLKSCVVNKYHTWWNEKNLIPPYDGCFKRFLKGAIKEYDPANDCRDLKQEIYDLFRDVLISYSYRNTVTILDTLTEAVGSIDFTVETPERFRRRTNIPQNERVSLGAAFFRALSSREKPPKDMKGKRLTQTLAKVDWLMKQSVLTTPEMWQYSAALIREQCRRESES
ncbi:hypothetical protein K4K60_001301 [Colletotrichum sp. SAR11_57]|nr:hypothetical protein K4K60_001301 [Colletotrichum sp. SAR11_57]